VNDVINNRPGVKIGLGLRQWPEKMGKRLNAGAGDPPSDDRARWPVATAKLRDNEKTPTPIIEPTRRADNGNSGIRIEAAIPPLRLCAPRSLIFSKTYRPSARVSKETALNAPD
jgi:hypothetical protein